MTNLEINYKPSDYLTDNLDSNLEDTIKKLWDEAAELSTEPLNFPMHNLNFMNYEDDGPATDITFPNKEIEQKVIQYQVLQQPKDSSEQSGLIGSVLKTARGMLGKPYISGRRDFKGADCSGLIDLCYRTNGVMVGPTTYSQFKIGKSIGKAISDVKPGDIMCFPGSGQTRKHVGLISRITGGKVYMIHAPKTGDVIKEVELTPYWLKRIVDIRRVVENNTPIGNKWQGGLWNGKIIKGQEGAILNIPYLASSNVYTAPEFEELENQNLIDFYNSFMLDNDIPYDDQLDNSQLKGEQTPNNFSVEYPVINITSEKNANSDIVPKKDYSKASANTIIDYFMGKGLTRPQAIGIAANFQAESSLDPYNVNKHSGAFGLAQWLGDRKQKLFARYGRKPNIQQQLDFVWYELNTTHKKGLQKLREANNAVDAARNFFGWFEFQVGPEGAVANMNKHKQNGRKALENRLRYAKGMS